MRMGALKICAPYIVMVLTQFAYGGFYILIKICLSKGLSQFVFLVYRHLLAMFLLGPLAYFLERKQRPSLSVPILIKIFFLSTLGTTIYQNVYYIGLRYTTATVGTALSNVTPAFTFIMALLFKLEKVKIKTAKGKAKVYGTFICIGGAMIFIFWNGGYHFRSLTRVPLIYIDDTRSSAHGSIGHQQEDWVKGSLLILTSFIALSASFILQALTSSVYPAPLSLSTLICFFTSLECTVLALIFEREPMAWKLEPNIQFYTLIYAGVVSSALVYYLQTWCISVKGPVFSVMFFPLSLLIVGVFSAIFFAEQLHLGSVIGAFLIIVGLYTVLWGKSTDVYSEGKVVNNDKSSLEDQETLEISIANQPFSMKIPTRSDERN